jgi:hypothetical protein
VAEVSLNAEKELLSTECTDKINSKQFL